MREVGEVRMEERRKAGGNGGWRVVGEEEGGRTVVGE
jgi:hypothetical protein